MFLYWSGWVEGVRVSSDRCGSIFKWICGCSAPDIAGRQYTPCYTMLVTCWICINSNVRICSAPPTVIPKVHYIVSMPCEKEKTSSGASECTTGSNKCAISRPARLLCVYTGNATYSVRPAHAGTEMVITCSAVDWHSSLSVVRWLLYYGFTKFDGWITGL